MVMGRPPMSTESRTNVANLSQTWFGKIWARFCQIRPKLAQVLPNLVACNSCCMKATQKILRATLVLEIWSRIGACVQRPALSKFLDASATLAGIMFDKIIG